MACRVLIRKKCLQKTDLPTLLARINLKCHCNGKGSVGGGGVLCLPPGAPFMSTLSSVVRAESLALKTTRP